jgi:hypothetical protein
VAAAAIVIPGASSASGIGYFSFEKTQLTKEVIANLAHLGLQDAALFQFGDISTSTSEDSHSQPQCKSYPGSDDWPSDVTWKALNVSLGGVLIKNIPLAAPCYNSWPAVRSNESCAYVTAHWTEPRFQYATSPSLL